MKKQNTCYDLLIEATANKDRFVCFYGHKIKVSSLIKDINNFASNLKSLGFLPGDVFSICLPTCPQAIVAFYACSKIGVILNIVHPILPVDKLLENLETTNSKGLMYYDILLKDHKKLENSNQILIKSSIKDYVVFRKPIFTLYSALKSKNIKRAKKYSTMVKKASAQAKITPNKTDTVCMMHSGGTTGTPKIIKLQNSALNELVIATRKLCKRDIDASESALAVLPVFHTFGLGIAIHNCFNYGYNIFLQPKFNAKKCNKIIKKHNITFIAGVPQIFEKLMNEKHFEGKHLAKLKNLWCGGDFVDDTLVKQFDNLVKRHRSSAKLMRGYGLTETCSVCCVNNDENYKAKSCGKPISNTTIEIWDDNNELLGHDKIGNIVIKSTSLMEGYLGEESGLTYKNGEKYVISGDLGYLDKDGFLFVVDRKKRSTKIAGVNVFPAEIEQVVKTLDFVDDAFAKIYIEKEKTLIKLFVTLKKTLDDTFVKNKILEVCKNNLIKYSVPSVIEILEKMPRTKMGKIDLNVMNKL